MSLPTLSVTSITPITSITFMMSGTCRICDKSVNGDEDKCLYLSPVYGQYFMKHHIDEQKFKIPLESIMTFCIDCGMEYLLKKINRNVRCENCKCFIDRDNYDNTKLCYDCKNKKDDGTLDIADTADNKNEESVKLPYRYAGSKCVNCDEIESNNGDCNWGLIEGNTITFEYKSAFGSRKDVFSLKSSYIGGEVINVTDGIICKTCVAKFLENYDTKPDPKSSFECDLCKTSFPHMYPESIHDSKQAWECSSSVTYSGIYSGYGSCFDMDKFIWANRIAPKKFDSCKEICDNCIKKLVADKIVIHIPEYVDPQYIVQL